MKVYSGKEFNELYAGDPYVGRFVVYGSLNGSIDGKLKCGIIDSTLQKKTGLEYYGPFSFTTESLLRMPYSGYIGIVEIPDSAFVHVHLNEYRGRMKFYSDILKVVRVIRKNTIPTDMLHRVEQFKILDEINDLDYRNRYSVYDQKGVYVKRDD